MSDTTQHTRFASKTIATSLVRLLTQVERLTQAHDALIEVLPTHEDEVVAWDVVIGHVNALGSATMRALTVANAELVPAMKAMYTQATAARDQIAQLDQTLADASLPSAGRVQCHGSAHDRDAAGQKIGPPRRCRNSAPARDPWCHNHGWQRSRPQASNA